MAWYCSIIYTYPSLSLHWQLGQSFDCPNASEVTVNDICKWWSSTLIWSDYEVLELYQSIKNHIIKTKYTQQTECIFYELYCTADVILYIYCIYPYVPGRRYHNGRNRQDTLQIRHGTTSVFCQSADFHGLLRIIPIYSVARTFSWLTRLHAHLVLSNCLLWSW